MSVSRCHICNENLAEVHPEQSNGFPYERLKCSTCGHYRVSFDFFREVLDNPANEALLPYLAAYIRRQNDADERPVELDFDNWRGFAEQHAHTPINRRLELLLRSYERSTDYAGAYVEFVNNIYPLVDAKNDSEVLFLAQTLAEQGLLQGSREQPANFRITGKGWEFLYPLTAGGAPGTCFIAMSFDPTLDDAYQNGILLAIEVDCGYRANRVDRRPHNESINDRIIAGIRASQFLVADFTLHRPNVYYEAGFAQGLGRTVVRTCRDTDYEHLGFDTRQYSHLKWTTVPDLRRQLAEHILATMGKWGQVR
jgi:hypothetical protein